MVQDNCYRLIVVLVLVITLLLVVVQQIHQLHCLKLVQSDIMASHQKHMAIFLQELYASFEYSKFNFANANKSLIQCWLHLPSGTAIIADNNGNMAMNTINLGLLSSSF